MIWPVSLTVSPAAYRDVLVASHVQRHKPDMAPALPRQGRRTARAITSGIVVTRVVDNKRQCVLRRNAVSSRKGWRGKQIEGCTVAGSVQL